MLAETEPLRLQYRSRHSPFWRICDVAGLIAPQAHPPAWLLAQVKEGIDIFPNSSGHGWIKGCEQAEGLPFNSPGQGSEAKAAPGFKASTHPRALKGRYSVTGGGPLASGVIINRKFKGLLSAPRITGLSSRSL